MFKLVRVTPLIAKGSLLPDNWGVRQQIPKKQIVLKNLVTGQVFTTTDLDMRKHKRRKRLALFKNFYIDAFVHKRVSVFLVVAEINKYKSAKIIIDLLKEKMNQYHVRVLGYYWQRDVGEVKFELHFHIIFVVERISGVTAKRMMSNKRVGFYKMVLCFSLNKFKRYLETKEIYGAHRQRSFGVSQMFKLPKTF